MTTNTNPLAIGTRFIHTVRYPWSTATGENHTQTNRALCEVTMANEHRIEYRVVGTLSVTDVPTTIEPRNMTGGGIATFAIPRLIAEGDIVMDLASMTQCPDCGSDDVGIWAATELRVDHDMSDNASCDICGWQYETPEAEWAPLPVLADAD